ncbi:histidine kinase [Clostridium sp. C8-1-8]|uniref:histidine kinase n=1 Tax=Clostridium sp. C8-1-8 TaxID=2698831 RepID=UPI001368F706|nr:histidine kinase [Clostridium sp. C8-1-8]
MKKNINYSFCTEKVINSKKLIDFALLSINSLFLYVFIKQRLLWALLPIGVNVAYYLYSLFALDYIKKHKNLSVIKRKLLDYETHTLFNTLNTISYFSRTNDVMARKLIVEISTYLREILKDDKKVVAIQDELKVLDTYIYIQNIRFEGNFTINADIYEIEYVPRFLLLRMVKMSSRFNILKQQNSFAELEAFIDKDFVCYTLTCKSFDGEYVNYDEYDSDFTKLFRQQIELEYNGTLKIDIEENNAKFVAYINKSFLGEVDV